MKKYRLDTFLNGEHIMEYFDSKEEAIKHKRKNGISFLLKKIECIGKYDVVEQL